MNKKGKYQRVEVKKPLGWKKITLIVLAVVLVLVAVTAAFGWNYFKGLIGLVNQAEGHDKDLTDEQLEAILGYVPEDEVPTDQTEPHGTTVPTTEPTTETTTAPTEPDYSKIGKIVNIMLVGQDFREGEESKLSDTMILCTLNRETKTLTMTSFQRDLYVQLPNYKGKICGMQRINVAYNLGWHWGGDLGGMEMLDLLILNNFGVEVDYNFEIDFNAFVGVIDKLGGLPIELDEDEAKYLTEVPYCEGSFEAGENVLRSDAALTYVRMRKATPSDSDINRTARQRKAITSIIKQCMSKSVTELNDLLKEILPMILTDMTEEEIMDLSMIAIGMLKDLKIESNQCPAPGTYWGEIVNIGGYDSGVLKCNLYANKERLMAIAEEGKSVSELDAEKTE